MSVIFEKQRQKHFRENQTTLYESLYFHRPGATGRLLLNIAKPPAKSNRVILLVPGVTGDYE
jgi:hypothetical protein